MSTNKLDVQTARENMAYALTLEGYATEDGLPVCPSCLKAEKGRATIHPDGGFKCHGCGFYTHNAVDFLTRSRVRHQGRVVGTFGSHKGDQVEVNPRRRGEQPTLLPASEVVVEGGSWQFATAVRALLGEDVPHPEGSVPIHTVVAQAKVTATPNPELYSRVLELGDVSAAAHFYGRFAIPPHVVEAFRVTQIVDQRALVAGLRKDFSPQDLIAAGLATAEGHLLVNARYPVIEPFILPDGRVAGMQFRASEETEAAIAAHKHYKAARDKALAESKEFSGEKVPFTPKFLSLVGTSSAQRCGFGLHLLQHAIDSNNPEKLRRVDIVEGAKDAMADTTFGHLSYGLPGAKVLPVRAVCLLLARFEEVHVCLDGDAAGAEGRAALLDHLQRFGINAVDHPPPDGMDIADVLMAKSRGE